MKGASDLKGMQDSKRRRSNVKRSMPTKADSVYLDLHVLQKEKEGLEKERSLLDRIYERVCKRREIIQGRLDEIGRQMEELQGTAEKQEVQATARGVIREDDASEKKWKTLSLSY